MEAERQTQSEIDFLDMFRTIWDGKWVIAGFVGLFLLLGVLFIFVSRNPFEATTQYRPIPISSETEYHALNLLGIAPLNTQIFLDSLDSFDTGGDDEAQRVRIPGEVIEQIQPERLEITRLFLHDMFVEELQKREVFIDAMQSVGLVRRDDFDSDAAYAKALNEEAIDVQIRPAVNLEGEVGPNVPDREFGALSFRHTAQDEWLQVLDQALAQAQENVRLGLESIITGQIATARYLQAAKLDRINLAIENSLADYERKASDRLAYLKEQAAIARSLGIDKGTLDAQIFAAGGAMIADLSTGTSDASERPTYLSGYVALEQEIALIEGRSDPRAFVEDLLALEQQKRAIEQDQTIARTEELLAASPIADKDRFAAVLAAPETTDFEPVTSLALFLLLLVIVGGLIGTGFVLLRRALARRSAAEA